MKKNLIFYLLIFTLSGCIHIYHHKEIPKLPKTKKTTKKKEKFKPWEETVKDAKKIEGFFNFYLKENHTLYIELKKEQLNKDFGLVMHFSKGVGDLNIIKGLSISGTRLLRFIKIGEKIYLIERNPLFEVKVESSVKEFIEKNVGHSIIADFKIESISDKKDRFLLNITNFLISDYPDISRWIKYYYDKKPVMFDKNKSYVEKLKGFPRNVEIDVILTYKSSDYPKIWRFGVSDYRFITFGIRYSFFALPEKPMMPRYADNRVGHFITAIKDISAFEKVDPYVRYIERWKLEKKDHSKKISEPVKPIVFYITRSVPEKYRKYVKEGIEAWNKAFEAAGFKNAIVAKLAPDDPNWDPEDIRYSTISWIAGHRMGYAIGPSQVDPRTGEILNADILIDGNFVRSWVRDYEELITPREMEKELKEIYEIQELLPENLKYRLCAFQKGMLHQMRIGSLFLKANGLIKTEKDLEKFIGDAIRDIVMHEVGHTLGLMHNFRASSAIPFEKLNDTIFTKENGLSISVMEYNPINVSSDPQKQGFYWNKTVGAYDIWAIKYAYAPIYKQTPQESFKYTGEPAQSPEEELIGLSKIIKEYTNPLHTFGSDVDVYLGDYATDPLTNVWDLSDDLFKFAEDRIRLIKKVLPKLEETVLEKEEDYYRLRRAFISVLYEKILSHYNLPKFIGGVYFVRHHKTEKKDLYPLKPVPANIQRKALRILIRNFFDINSFKFDKKLLNKLSPNRWTHWGMRNFYPVDFPVHDYVKVLQKLILENIFTPIRLERITDNIYRTSDKNPFTLKELFEKMTESIFKEIKEPEKIPINSFRRNLQKMYVDILKNILLKEKYPYDAKILSRHYLKKILQYIEKNIKNYKKLDVVEYSHLEYLKEEIHKTLKTSFVKEIKN